MYLKREYIPEERALNLNYLVIDNARLIKEDQEPLKDIEPIYAEEPIQCFNKCTTVGGNNRCNVVEYDQITKLCKLYDLPQDDHITLKFRFTDKELLGESFTTSTVESLKKQNISKEECINMFNSNTESIFYNYKEDGSFTECIVGIAAASENHSFAINLNSFNAQLNYINPNTKYQVEADENTQTKKTGVTKPQKQGSKDDNGIPLLLVGIGIVGVIIITGLIYYGIRMVNKANKLNKYNSSRNTRNQISYKIKNSDPYSSNSSKGSKNSTLNNSKGKSNPSQHSYYSYNRSQHSTVSNIAPQIYEYNETSTYVSSVPNSFQQSSLQDFYNNASLSFGVPNYGNSNYGSSNHASSNYSKSNYSNPSYSNLNYFKY